MTNIPIYRAKKIDSDEYIIGYYGVNNIDDTYHYITNDCTFWEDSGLILTEHIIDPSTLSINFKDMKDSEDNPIFASLSEDGKGGDIVYVAGIGDCYLAFDIDGAYCRGLEGKIITHNFYRLSEDIAENDVERVIGIKE